MNEYWQASDKRGEATTLDGGARAVARLHANTDQSATLAGVDGMIAALDNIVRASEDVGAIDDETLNWCFTEVEPHLRSAVWSIAGGFYPTALSAMRRALNIGLLALELCLAEREAAMGALTQPDGASGQSYVLSDFEAGTVGLSTVELIHGLAKRDQLRSCADSASVSFGDHVVLFDAQLGDLMRAHHLQNGYGPPCFHPDGFDSSIEGIREVIGVIGACWIGAIPGLTRVVRSTVTGDADLDAVFVHPWPRRVLAAAKRVDD